MQIFYQLNALLEGLPHQFYKKKSKTKQHYDHIEQRKFQINFNKAQSLCNKFFKLNKYSNTHLALKFAEY